MALEMSMLLQKAIGYLTKPPVPGVRSFLWTACQGSPYDLQSNIGCFQVPWLHPRTGTQGPAADETTCFRQKLTKSNLPRTITLMMY